MDINIKDYGAIGDGTKNNTRIIQNCIDLCANTGQRVVIEGGTFLCGTIYMKSNVNLVIMASAVLLASPHIGDYATDTHYNRYRNEKEMDRCWIYAEDQMNFSITGFGEINGNSEMFPNENDNSRPMMMRFLRCRNICLEGVKLYHAAAWSTAFLDSSYIRIRNVTIWNEKRYNGDGLDFDGCAHVFISGCSITGTDDNLCLQAGNPKYPTEHIHISDCEFTSICAAIRIGLKSVGTIRNVVISNCTMRNVWREGIKIECTEGGSISDITVNNIIMNNVSRPLFVLLNNRFLPDDLGTSVELEEIPEIGTLQRLIFSNIIAIDDEEMSQAHYRFQKDIMGAPWFNGIRFDAENGHKIKNVKLENIWYTAFGGVKNDEVPKSYPQVLDQLVYLTDETSGNYYPDWSRTTFMDARNVENLYLSDLRFSSLHPDERSAYLLEGCSLLKEEIAIVH